MATKPPADSVEKIHRALRITEETTAKPILIVITGLPGTGKSFLARRVAARLPCVIVESDWVRKTLTDHKPTYSGAESAHIHRVAHAVIERLLASGRRVIFDATNLAEWQREQLYRIGHATRATLVIVRTVAPEAVIRERLTRRLQNRDPLDISDADWDVHQLLRSELEPVRRPHLVVDTSGDLDQAVTKILRVAGERGFLRRTRQKI